MRKFLFVFIFAILAACIYFGLRSDKNEVQEVIVHDTVYKDTMYLTVHDTVYYDAKWLRKKFKTAERKIWKNYWDEYEVEYPEFMEEVELMEGNRVMKWEYRDISMIAKAYDEEVDMSVKEKYEGLKMFAISMSEADSSFLSGGKCGKSRMYIEKDIKLKPCTWMYLRVEFPSELTLAVYPLLGYVENFKIK